MNWYGSILARPTRGLSTSMSSGKSVARQTVSTRFMFGVWASELGHRSYRSKGRGREREREEVSGEGRVMKYVNKALSYTKSPSGAAN